MKRAILKISDSYLMKLLSTMKSFYNGNFSVAKNPLPEDVKIIRVGHDHQMFLSLLLQSDEFEDIKEGELYPVLDLPEIEFVLVKTPEYSETNMLTDKAYQHLADNSWPERLEKATKL